jgi:serine/threonine protein kinase
MKTRIPEHYCRNCVSVVYAEDKQCLECGGARPTDGWPLLSEAFDPWLGHTIDDTYLLTNRVGRGASAVVYRAESLKIGRQFAIKLIDLTSTDNGRDPELLRARLDREVDAIGQLRSPHTVQFYDVIEPAEGWVGIIMDFIEGDTLEQLVEREGPLGMERSLRLLRQVANGLHEAHEVGLIHRDLKPENIMVEFLPAGDDFAHLVDFGIVWADDGVHVTKGFVGTPLYSSPEQAIGGTVDRRSDIYSLGAILFFMLSGRPPFESRNVLEVLSKHVKKKPPRLADVMPGIPPPTEVEELVSGMLSKNPESRPANLGEVIATIDSLVDMATSTTGEEQFNQYGESLREESESGGTAHGLLFDPSEGIDSADESHDDPITGVFEKPSTGVFERTLSEESDSFVESVDHDETGPKAAIFKLRTSGVHRAQVDASSDGTASQAGAETDEPPTVDIEEPKGSAGIGIIRTPFRTDTVWASGSRHRFAYWNDEDAIVMLKMTPRSQFEIPIGPDDEIESLALSSRHLLLGYQTGEVARVNLTTGAGSVLFEDIRRLPMSAVGCDERDFTILAGSATGRLYMLRAFRKSTDWVCIQTGDPVTAVSVSPMGDVFAVVRNERFVGVFDASSSRRRLSSLETTADVLGLSFSGDSHLLAVALADGRVLLRQTFTGQQIIAVDDVDPNLLGVYFNHESDLLAIAR